MSDVQTLVDREPWRTGQGQPSNALDPTWSISRSVTCDGEISFEQGTSWWWCGKCGYCGRGSYLVHKPIQNPLAYLYGSISDYLAKRAEQGIEKEAAIEQMLHIAGVAIRYAASYQPDDIGRFVRQFIVR